MYIKIHKSKYSDVVAVCDKDLIGKTIKDGEIEICISEKFYKGEEKTEKEIIQILKEARNINLMGKKSISAGLKAKVIDNRNIIEIKGIPHAQAYSV